MWDKEDQWFLNAYAISTWKWHHFNIPREQWISTAGQFWVVAKPYKLPEVPVMWASVTGQQLHQSGIAKSLSCSSSGRTEPLSSNYRRKWRKWTKQWIIQVSCSMGGEISSPKVSKVRCGLEHFTLYLYNLHWVCCCLVIQSEEIPSDDF